MPSLAEFFRVQKKCSSSCPCSLFGKKKYIHGHVSKNTKQSTFGARNREELLEVEGEEIILVVKKAWEGQGTCVSHV